MFSTFGLDRASLEAQARVMLGRLPARYLLELRRFKINETEIFLHLSFIWQTSRVRAKSLTTVPGVSIEAIRKLPNLLRRAAKQVNSINQHGVIRRLFFRRSWQGIPSSLLSFATALEEALEAQKSQPRKLPDPDTLAKVRFVQYVLETSTDKRQHYREVAKLINAFNGIQDDTSTGTSKRVTAESLKILWLENEHLRKTPPHLEIPCRTTRGGLFGSLISSPVARPKSARSVGMSHSAFPLTQPIPPAEAPSVPRTLLPYSTCLRFSKFVDLAEICSAGKTENDLSLRKSSNCDVCKFCLFRVLAEKPATV
jgi:hypothetical protein